jgi:hypothetical protein
MAENEGGETGGLTTAQRTEKVVGNRQKHDQRRIISERVRTGKVGESLQQPVLQTNKRY